MEQRWVERREAWVRLQLCSLHSVSRLFQTNISDACRELTAADLNETAAPSRLGPTGAAVQRKDLPRSLADPKLDFRMQNVRKSVNLHLLLGDARQESFIRTGKDVAPRAASARRILGAVRVAATQPSAAWAKLASRCFLVPGDAQSEKQ